MLTTPHRLQPDTQAILLLCASFGQSRSETVQPLSLKEYNILAQNLQKHHLRPADLLQHEGREQLPVFTTDPQRLGALLNRGAMLALAVEKWHSKGLWVLSRSDEAYPRILKTKLRHAAPAILYGVGEQKLLVQGGLAIVGSREVNEEGFAFTQKVAQACAAEAMQVISGGARGVDQVAMLAAIEAGGTVLGILADSLAQVAVSKKYRDAIRAHQLTLVSPYDPDARFQVWNAMGRNKYIYALADYGLVVSSGLEQGGTWAGAKEALSQQPPVPVFVRMQGAIPAGNSALIQLGGMPWPTAQSSSLSVLLPKTIIEHQKNSQFEAILNINSTLEDKVIAQAIVETHLQPKDEEIDEAIVEVTSHPAINSHSEAGMAEAVIETASTPNNELITEAIVALDSQPRDEAIFEAAVTSNAILNHQEFEDDSMIQLDSLETQPSNPTNDYNPLPTTIFTAVLPLILQHLQEPMSEKKLAEILEVRPTQLRDWLQRAITEGQVERTKKGYLATPNTEQLSFLA